MTAADTDRPDKGESERPAGALTVPAFRYLWFNNVLFFLVVNAQRFTFGWLVLDGLDRDEFWQGLVTFALGIPVAFLILPAGAWADRYNRKHLLMISQVLSFAVMAMTTFLVATDQITIASLLVLAVLFGASQAIAHPVRSSLIPALVSSEQLFNAIAINAIAMTLSMILGPVLFQIIGESTGFGGAFGAQTALLALGAVSILPLRVPTLEADRIDHIAPISTAGSSRAHTGQPGSGQTLLVANHRQRDGEPRRDGHPPGFREA